MDAGTGQYVVELVDQQRLHQRRDVRFVRRDALLHRAQHRRQLQVVQRELQLAVVALDGVLVGQRAAVQLEIQLACVGRGLADARLQLAHELRYRLVTAAGHALQVGHAPRHLQHFKLRSAAAVALAVGEQPPVGAAVFIDGVVALRDLVQRQRRGPDVRAVQVRQHLRAVQPLPVEGGVGERIGVVPGHLGGQEILHPAALHDLRNGVGVAEGVGQPERVRGVAKAAARVTLPPHELTHHVLAARQVAVALHPYAAVGLVAPLLDRRADALEQLGVVALDHRAVVGRGLHKAVLRVFLHQVERVGVGAGALLHRLADGPEPGGVHVAVPHQPHKGRGAAVLFAQLRLEQRRGAAQALVELLLRAGCRVIIQPLVHLTECVLHVRPAERRSGGRLAQLQQCAQVKVIVEHCLVPQADLYVTHAVEKAVLHLVLQRLRAGHAVIRIVFQRQLDALARRSPCTDAVAVVVAVRAHDLLARVVGVDAPVHPQRGLVAVGQRAQEQRLPVQLRRHGVAAAEPAIGALAAPGFGQRAEVLLRRDGVQHLLRLIELHVDGVHGAEESRLQRGQETGELLLGLTDRFIGDHVLCLLSPICFCL